MGGWSKVIPRNMLDFPTNLLWLVFYVENVPEELYAALKARAKSHRKSGCGGVGLLEENTM
jgi:hypothetical protein